MHPSHEAQGDTAGALAGACLCGRVTLSVAARPDI